jgi:hypothetical protein
VTRYRNASGDAVLDQASGRAVEPGGLIEVDDDQAEHYADHPVWRRLRRRPTRTRTTDK